MNQCLATQWRWMLITNGLKTSKNLLGTRNFVRLFGNDASTEPGRSYSEKKETHFGFQSVKESEKADKVYEVFRNVSSKYDLMNDAISLGIHRFWKDQFVDILKPTPGIKLLDVAGGTGDISFRILNYLKNLEAYQTPPVKVKENDSVASEAENVFYTEPLGHFSQDNKNSHIVVSDINQHMLNVGMERAQKLGFQKGISWLCADAEHLPIEDASFDVYTIAFGIRNCVHMEKVLLEANRVLKPGGRFMCLEFSRVKNPVASWLYDHYSFQVIPVIGQILAQDWKSYQYLVESIRNFPEQEKFLDLIRSAGFSLANYTNMSLGAVAIHSGFKL